MEARLFRAVLITAALVSLGASYRTPNFVINAPTERFAKEVGEAAETYRRELAEYWLGEELPRWSQPCPVTLDVGPQLGAGGATSFLFDRGEVYGWRMSIQGSEERILDSVLPHEVTHTIFASHFRQPLPRWADEGACTTVEHVSERAKQRRMLIEFLQTGRGIAFSDMFRMREYPPDVMPLYSQGYSLARFLIEQGGQRKYMQYIGDGLDSGDWTKTTERHYGFSDLASLQSSWLEWVQAGSPALDVSGIANQESAPQPGNDDVVVRAQNQGRLSDFLSRLNPLRRAEAAGTARPATTETASATPSAYRRRDRSVAANAGEAPPWNGSTAQTDAPLAPAPPSAPAAYGQPLASASQPSAVRSDREPRQVLLEWSRDERAAQSSLRPAGPLVLERPVLEDVLEAPTRTAPAIYFDAPPRDRGTVWR